jgi:hypothetical protein
MSYLVKLYDGISEIKRLNPTVASGRKKGSGKKGIRGMTRKSARSLLKYLMRLEATRNVFFLTLTYRDTPSIEESKKQLNTFFTGLKYVYPEMSGVWNSNPEVLSTSIYYFIQVATKPVPLKSVMKSSIGGAKWSEIVTATSLKMGPRLIASKMLGISF